MKKTKKKLSKKLYSRKNKTIKKNMRKKKYSKRTKRTKRNIRKKYSKKKLIGGMNGNEEYEGMTTTDLIIMIEEKDAQLQQAAELGQQLMERVEELEEENDNNDILKDENQQLTTANEDFVHEIDSLNLDLESLKKRNIELEGISKKVKNEQSKLVQNYDSKEKEFLKRIVELEKKYDTYLIELDGKLEKIINSPDTKCLNE